MYRNRRGWKVVAVAVVGLAGVSIPAATAQKVGGGALGGAVRGALIAKAAGGKSSKGAAYGAIGGAVRAGRQKQQRAQQQAYQQQLEAERARATELEMRERERQTEERARAEYEAKLQAQEPVDFRELDQRQQIEGFYGAPRQLVHIDMYEHSEAWDNRARQDIQMIEQRYGPEAAVSLRQRIMQLQKMRDDVLKGQG